MFALYTVHCTMYNCTLYTVQCTASHETSSDRSVVKCRLVFKVLENRSGLIRFVRSEDFLPLVEEWA